MNDIVHSHRVSVCGETLQIRSDVPAEVIEEIAAYVEAKVREAGTRMPQSTDKLKAAVLAAMNITGELFEVRSRLRAYEEHTNALGEKMRNLTEELDLATALAE